MVENREDAAESAGQATTPDARTERWAKHRLLVRSEFVDAAFRALDKIGPEATLRDICDEAGAQKPKLYRFFEDKADPYNAIGDRVAEMLWESLVGSVDLLNDTARELVRKVVAEFAANISERPNVFRFMVHGHFGASLGSSQSERIVDTARAGIVQLGGVATAVLGDALDSEFAELIVYSLFGTVVSSADWWLGIDQERTSSIPIDAFVDHVSMVVVGVLQTSLLSKGIVVDPDQPLHAAFAAAEPA